MHIWLTMIPSPKRVVIHRRQEARNSSIIRRVILSGPMHIGMGLNPHPNWRGLPMIPFIPKKSRDSGNSLERVKNDGRQVWLIGQNDWDG